MGKSTINGPFSIAMSNYQRVFPNIVITAPPVAGEKLAQALTVQ